MPYRICILAAALFIQQCKPTRLDNVDDDSVRPGSGEPVTEVTDRNKTSEVANMAFSVGNERVSEGSALPAKEVGELFAFDVYVERIDLAKVAAGYREKLGSPTFNDIDVSDMQVQASIITKSGEQILVSEAFVKDGKAVFDNLYVKEVCRDCQLVAELGTYGNRGCAGDCDYPFVPIEPSTKISFGLTIEATPYVLQVGKKDNRHIEIRLTKNDKAASNTVAEIVACVYVPPRRSWTDIGTDSGITYCSVPDFADFGGQQAIDKQNITLDADGSWSGKVDTAVEAKICEVTVYLQAAGRAFIEKLKDSSCN